MIHPIACWKTDDDLVIGVLVGTPHRLAQRDERGVTAGLAAVAEEAGPGVASARLERQVVSVRLASLDQGRRAIGATVPIPVDVVIGETASGIRVWIPRMEVDFSCPNERVVREIVAEEVLAWARNRSPEAILAEQRVPRAELTWIIAKRPRPAKELAERHIPEILGRVAEREPVRGRPLEPGAWGRESLVTEVTAALRRKRSVILIGERSVGKSTVIREAIKQVATESDARTFWRTTTHRIVAGSQYLGEWQEKADDLAQALLEAEGTLWVEDFDALFTYGGDPSASIAAYWRRRLVARELALVGELTPRVWEITQTLLPDVARSFVVIRIDETTLEATRLAVDRFASLVADARGVEVPTEARRRTIRLLDRFVRYERFPGKAIRLLRALVDEAIRDERAALSESDVVAAFERRTGLPRALVDDTVPMRREELVANLGQSIIGQPEALDAVARVLLTWKAGLDDPGRPVATLLFAGPTGVGKTATTKALGELCYGGSSRSPLVRIDASELGSPHQVERLLGRIGEPSAAIRELRERPFAVLLIDEVEKAHPLLFDLLLGVLDEGRLVDAIGRETDLRGCIVVMTTNLGTRSGASLGFGGGAASDPGAVRAFFRPEFVNRIDEIVHFRPLDELAVRSIAERELALIERRPGFSHRGLELVFTHAVVDRVVSAGFDPRFGARPLQRAIEQYVVAALARHLVDHPDGLAMSLVVDVVQGTVTVSPR